MKLAKIYLIKLKEEPKYIGFTTNSLKNRWKDHCNDAKRGSKTLLHNAIRMHGIENFSIELLYTSHNIKETLEKMEPKFIVEYNTYWTKGTGFNMTSGGEGALDVIVSEETRKKRSNSLKNRFFSEETRRKISEAKKGKRRSEETKKKISEGHKNSVKAMNHVKELIKNNTGKRLTEEHKLKISQSNKKRILFKKR